ncbi:ABC transporter ATP-binding protein [Qiania dongpingensis]|uniref:ABC transporter ATP-binding protein n=1 Tax=Qiania dongpingensis TaxID=2763669 RepID=A0A7G9G7L7_9FIRM|nr:ABC transporter ATP-binding protein [Qiania dongpingensis]QNM06799.1 ABC transporter ATP-binding protein [Qiania dongpingensis]
MIQLEHVSKVYNGMHKAVDDCSFSVEDGKITGFIGPNGAGKTTTLKMITGILEATEGSITLDGVDIKRNGVEAKKKIGFVSDNPDSFLRLKGLEYLNFMADIYDVPTEGRSEKIKEMAERFEMADALGDKILSYSHGMRQKIMVMGALLHSPSLWILDEPLTGLDPKAAFELKDMMREHADSGCAVLFSTHVLEVAEKLCDKVVIINKGRIVFQGTLDQLRHGYPEGTSLEEIFLAVTEHA